MRLQMILMIVLTAFATTAAGEDSFIMNFDLNTLRTDGSVEYSIQLQGVQLAAGKAFHGDDLGNYEYFLTVSQVDGDKGKLIIEFYEFESRRKTSDVISEIVTEVEFALGNPAVFEGKTETFGVDLAFNISGD